MAAPPRRPIRPSKHGQEERLAGGVDEGQRTICGTQMIMPHHRSFTRATLLHSQP